MPRVVVLAALLLAGLGCRNPFGSDRRITLPVREIAAPAELERNATLVLTLTVVLNSGCRSFERFQAERSPSHLVLTAHGRDGARSGVDCTTDIRLEPKSYQAAPPFSDPLTIVVRQPDGTELVREVRIR